LPPQKSDNGRLGNPPRNQPPHFDHQVLQGGLSNGKTTALNSPGSKGKASAQRKRSSFTDHPAVLLV